MPKIDIDSIRDNTGCDYPAPFDQPCIEPARTRLGDAGGLADFDVNPDADTRDYPDIDLRVAPWRNADYTHKNGAPYPAKG